MNFWQKTKRFVEPLWVSKKILILHTLIHIVYEVGKIIPIVLLILSQKNGGNEFFLYFSIGYVVVGVIIIRFLRHYYWLIPGYNYLQYLTKKNIHEFALKDNLSYESL